MKYLYFLFLLPITFFAQVPVDINSGNPTFPFPQFLAYEYEENGHRLENLAHQNPDGLVHAEMELRISEAWQILANRFSYTGESHDGVNYIQSTEGCQYIDCSEGEGYSLIAAAYMGDKTIFDGIWFKVHDLKLVKYPRYIDGEIAEPNYIYGENALKEPGGNSAADGDVDIALGLLMAWKQWGDNSGYTAFNGDVISYKEEALNVIRGLVERQNQNFSEGDCRSVSGIIGFDGYIKGGNTWGELTNWVDSANLYEGMCPEFSGSTQQHVDYVAPSYFRDFAEFLEEEGGDYSEDEDWHIPQLQRAEASSDWFMGELYNQGANTIPVAGWVSLDEDNNAAFSNFDFGEDNRYAWRTILNHTWHGNPKFSWNPISHQVIDVENSNNLDMANRLVDFINDPRPFGNSCINPGGDLGMTFTGPSQLFSHYNPNDASILIDFPINWMPGCSSPASVSSQDFDLMGKLYRQCAIEWDISDNGDGNLTSVPAYFHGFFRLLGMLTTTGNLYSPMNIEPQANIKIYSEVDKTFSFTNDILTYTFSYRNYGSVDANNVIITDVIPEGLEFVSATNGGVLSGNSIIWNINTVPGFSSGGLESTKGELTVTFRVKEAFSGRVCNPVSIETSTGEGWVSNDFPNEDSEVMQRNCVDIVEQALEIEKTVDYEEVNPGDVVTYTLDVTNSSSGGYINGGRSGVNFAYAREEAAFGETQGLKIRLYHGADEPYINYENYRISLFLNDNIYKCIAGTEGCENGWALRTVTYAGGEADDVIVSQEDIVPGSDDKGNWNQRVMVQFADQKCAPITHLLRYYGLEGRIHEGGSEPLRGIWDLYTSNNGEVDWSDDWSWDVDAVDSDSGFFYPVTNDWTDPNNPDVPVTIYHNEACEKPTKTVDNVLIEEWDGYTWRRIYGSGPVPGRDVENVVLRDVLPDGFEFVEFIGDAPLGIDPVVSEEGGRTVISWEADSIQIGQDVQIVYKAIAQFSEGKTCDTEDQTQTNLASISANNESPVEASVDVVLTCNPVILPPAESSMVKEVSPISAEVGDEVVYTLAYKNEDGSPVEVPLTNTDDWTLQSSGSWSFNSGTLQNPPTNYSSPQIITYNYSHGTNGILEANLVLDLYTQFGIVLRHTGAGGVENGLYLMFKGGNTTIEISIYDGTTLLESQELASPGTTFNTKILLNEGDLNVWLGDTSSPSPSWTASNLPVSAGYFGFINGTPTIQDAGGLHTVTRFYSAMDSAFNVQITDPIPGELSFVSSVEGENIDGVVTFPLLEGPVLANVEIAYEWTAEIVSCPADLLKIDNIAYTNIFGIEENSIAAQAILDCSGVDLCGDTPEVPLLTEGEEILICSGDSTEINAIDYVNTTSTDYELIWFDGPSKFDNEIDAPEIDTSVDGEFVYYVAQIEDVVCGEGDRISLTFVVGGEGAEASTEEITIESGETVGFDVISEMGFTTGNVQWIASENLNIEGESILAIIDDTITDVLINTSGDEQIVEYSIEELSSNDCGKGVSTLIVTVTSSLCLTEAPAAETVEYCLNELMTDTIDSYVIADGTVLWYADNDLTSEAITMPVIDTSLQGGITYYVSQVIDNCESERVEVLVKESEGSTEVIEHTEVILSNESLSFDILLETGLITGSFEWSASNNLNVTGYTNSISSEAVITDTLINDSNIEQQIEYTITPFNCNEAIHVLSVTIRTLPSVEISTSAVVEGDDFQVELIFSKPTVSETIITLGLNPGSIDGVSVGDLSLDDIIVVIPEGAENYSFAIPTIDDDLSEPSENLEISIKSVDSENLTDLSEIIEVAIIDNDGLPSILIDDIEILEGETKAVDIRLSNPSSEDITITVSLVFTNDTTSDGDFELLDTGSITVSFAAGETQPTTQTNITAIDDSIPEGDQVLIVSVATVDNGVLNDSTDTAEIIIIDDDLAPTVLIDDVQVNEGNTIEIPIYLKTPALDRIELIIGFTDVDTNGDFDTTERSLVFEEGSRIPTAPLEIEIFQDLVAENDEDFIVYIASIVEGTVNSGGLIGLDSGIVTIQDDDLEIEIIIGSGVSVTEGESIEVPISLSNPAVDLIEITVDFTDIDTSGSIDYDNVAQVLQFNIGETQPISPLIITTVDDILIEENEDFEISFSVISGYVSNATNTGLATILDNDSAPDVIISDLTLEEGETKEINIELLTPAIDDIILTLRIENDSSSDDDYILTTQEVTFSAGNTLPDTPITIEAIEDDLVEGGEVLQVSVGSVDSGSVNKLPNTAEIIIEDNDQTVVIAIPDCALINNPTNGETEVSLRPTISWDSVADADGYLLSVGTTPNGTDVVATVDVEDNESYFISFNLEENTTYFVLVTPYNTEGSATGCISSNFITQEAVEVSKNKYGLSPDGDGINEFWLIDNIEEYPDNEVYVYNRWGDLVFRMKNYDNSFNVFTGEANELTNLGAGELQSGTYFYEIKINGEHDFSALKGFLVLKR